MSLTQNHRRKPPWRSWRDKSSDEVLQVDTSCAPFGTLLGIAYGGIPAYSSNYDNIPDPSQYPDRTYFRNKEANLFYGMKYQCVEFARRWLIHVLGITFTPLNFALEIFELPYAVTVEEGTHVPWKSIPNGSSDYPRSGDVMIWAEGGEFLRTGHVAIVTEASDRWVRIAEQNVEDTVWPEHQNWARELKVTIDPVTGGYCVHDSFGAGGTIKGWMRVEDGFRPAPIPLNQYDAIAVAAAAAVSNSSVANADYVHISPTDISVEGVLPALLPRAPFLRQFTYVVPNSEFYERNWLDFSIPASQVYCDVDPYDGTSVPHVYFTMPQSKQNELSRATEILHDLFLKATAYVLDHPSYWSRFSFPRAFWDLAKQSFVRGDKSMCGRFDFSISPEHGTKCYEYNADSAACLFECAYTEDARMSALGLGDVGINGGVCTASLVIEAWKDCVVNDGSNEEGTAVLVHFIGGIKGYEETYHRDYMMHLAAQAGVRCKHIVAEELSFGAEGVILDKEGESVRYLWKTWSYSTLLLWLETEGPLRTSGDEVRTLDVCLSRNIIIFEPPWTAVTANKAILPVLWELFPNCPYALESSLHLTDSLNARPDGYVTKPIFGRCGDNVTLHIAAGAGHIIGNMVEAAVQSTAALDISVPQKVTRMNSEELNSILPDNTTLQMTSPDLIVAELPRAGFQVLKTTNEEPVQEIVPSNETVATFASNGRFHSSSMIYQELCPLPFVDGYFVQVNTFCANGKFAGSVLRVDRTAIIVTKSAVVPLRIVANNYINI